LCESLETTLLEVVAASPFADGVFGQCGAVLAVAAELIPDFRIERAVALDINAVETAVHAWRPEGVVPVGINLWGGNSEAAAGDARIAPLMAGSAMVEIKVVEGDVAAGALACGFELGTAVDDDVVVDVNVGDVGGAAEEIGIAGDG